VLYESDERQIAKGAYLDVATVVETGCQHYWAQSEARLSSLALYSCTADATPGYLSDGGMLKLSCHAQS
jgi:hypothetical protein